MFIHSINISYYKIEKERNKNAYKLLPDFLDEIEGVYNINILELAKSSMKNENLDDLYEKITKKIKEKSDIDETSNSHRFLQMQSTEKLNPLALIKNLGTDEMFYGKKADSNDDLPEPNTKEGGAPCTSPGDCLGFQLKIMK